MIKVAIGQLDQKGIDISGNEPESFLDLSENAFLSFPGGVDYSLHVSTVNSNILVSGKVSAILQSKCGRCLEPFKLTITNDKICHFLEDVTETEIDLTDDIREDLLINLPQNLLCHEDCQGLCSHCGVNRNNSTCSCESKTNSNEAWKALDDFKT